MIWQNIPKYKNYQVSNHGEVRRLPNFIKCRNGVLRFQKGRILKTSINSHGYRCVLLSDGDRRRNFKVASLVGVAFLGYKMNGKNDLVIDHVNGIKTDDRLLNLQVITHRENCSKDKKGTSKYTGVSWNKSKGKWLSSIQINGRSKNLGHFNSELQASTMYQNALSNI